MYDDDDDDDDGDDGGRRTGGKGNGAVVGIPSSSVPCFRACFAAIRYFFYIFLYNACEPGRLRWTGRMGLPCPSMRRKATRLSAISDAVPSPGRGVCLPFAPDAEPNAGRRPREPLRPVTSPSETSSPGLHNFTTNTASCIPFIANCRHMSASRPMHLANPPPGSPTNKERRGEGGLRSPRSRSSPFDGLGPGRGREGVRAVCRSAGEGGLGGTEAQKHREGRTPDQPGQPPARTLRRVGRWASPPSGRWPLACWLPPKPCVRCCCCCCGSLGAVCCCLVQLFKGLVQTNHAHVSPGAGAGATELVARPPFPWHLCVIPFFFIVFSLSRRSLGLRGKAK